jgi:UDP-N-acetyl-D-glucosamine dehydrogenase
LHTLDLLNELAGESLDGRKITVCGLSYLPEVADARNSPTRLLVDELTALGARVTVHDPYVLSWPERPDVQLGSHLGTCLSGAQGIVFAVPHKMYQDLSPQQLIQYVGGDFYVVDAQNVLHDAKAKYLHSAGCRLAGVGKGHWRKQEFQCPKV